MKDRPKIPVRPGDTIHFDDVIVEIIEYVRSDTLRVEMHRFGESSEEWHIDYLWDKAARSDTVLIQRDE